MELDAGQIVDDLPPISRLEGDIFYREYWMLNPRCHPEGIFAVVSKILMFGKGYTILRYRFPRNKRFGGFRRCGPFEYPTSNKEFPNDM